MSAPARPVGVVVVTFNSAGTLIIAHTSSLYVCKAGSCAERGALPTSDSRLYAFPNDQLLLRPYLSVSTTTDW